MDVLSDSNSGTPTETTTPLQLPARNRRRQDYRRFHLASGTMRKPKCYYPERLRTRSPWIEHRYTRCRDVEFHAACHGDASEFHDFKRY